LLPLLAFVGVASAVISVGVVGLGVAAIAAGVAGAAAAVGGAALRRLADRVEQRLGVRDGTLAPQVVDAVRPQDTFIATESALVSGAPRADARRGNRGEDSPSAAAFRSATVAMLTSSASETVAAAPLQPLALGELRQRLRSVPA
jgi:hypothetical protein